MSYLEKIDKTRLPQHIAIIMDGNGRWAKERNMERTYGHKYGVDAVRTVTEAAVEIGVKYLTLYTFSTENWSRPDEEITALMALMPDEVKARLNKCIAQTSVNTGLTLILALSYSSRWEITDATKRIAADVASGQLAINDIDEFLISSRLTTAAFPDPDLLIRTGGELRISNFLMWQLSYAELYFTEEYWPDFGKESLYKAICDYQSRERRFGKISEQL